MDSNFDSDTKIFGLPIFAIPVYFDGSSQVKSASFDATTTRIYERLTTSFQQAAYSSNTATIQLGVSNLSGFDVTSYEVACEVGAGVSKASSATTSVTVSPLVAGERYLCNAVAHTATGQGKTSDAFLIELLQHRRKRRQFLWVPEPQTSAQINFSSNGEGTGPITSYSVACEIPSLAPSQSLQRKQTRSIGLGSPTQQSLRKTHADGSVTRIGRIYHAQSHA